MEEKDIQGLSRDDLIKIALKKHKPTAILVVLGVCGAAEGLYWCALHYLDRPLPDVVNFIWVVFLIVTFYTDRQVSKIERKQEALIELLRKANVINN